MLGLAKTSRHQWTELYSGLGTEIFHKLESRLVEAMGRMWMQMFERLNAAVDMDTVILPLILTW